MIPLFKVYVAPEVDEPLFEVLHSGFVGQGHAVEEFEGLLGSRLGNPNVVTTNSGTSALQLALRLAYVGPGTDVISTPMTCTATNMPILAAGANIIWADIDPHTGNIDVGDVYKKLTPKTKAVMCVDWGGYPCDLDELYGLCESHGLSLIEDAAHAFGATYKDRELGRDSNFTIFSFQAIKYLTTVDGGALMTRMDSDCKRGKLLRWYGIDRDVPGRKDFRCEADIAEYGLKWHMNDVNATIGFWNFQHIDELLASSRANAAYYDRELLHRVIERTKPLAYKNDRLSTYWLYTVLVDDRDGFVDYMKRNGIQASQVHKRNDVHTCFKQFKTKLKGVDEFSKHQVSIPVGWWVTDEHREKIMDAIEAWEDE